jgi:DNA primase
MSESDPIAAKYVNSPESELFRKGSLVYGLDQARAAVAKEDRAVIVEGYTDVLALHQLGLTAAVASMGTALTAPQLKELRRLCGRLFLCFDADAAGEAATLRGMELAVGEGFDVHVVALPAGADPAEAAEGFEERLSEAEPYALYRIKLEIDRAESKEEAFRRVRDVVAPFDQNTEWIDAMKYAADRLRLPPELQAGLAPRPAARTGKVRRKILEAGHRLERDALAGCVAHAELVPVLAELGEEHFDDELHRRLRAHLVARAAADREVVALLAELDARAEAEGIDEDTAKQLLLRLRERELRRELASADFERTKELQAALRQVREAAGEPV